jgi:hypothetical protein
MRWISPSASCNSALGAAILVTKRRAHPAVIYRVMLAHYDGGLPTWTGVREKPERLFLPDLAAVRSLLRHKSNLRAIKAPAE